MNKIALFKYINSRGHINSYYLLDKKCAILEEVREIGNVIINNSFKHKLLFLHSKVIASTEKNIIEPWGSRMFYRHFSKFYPKKIKVFLQHGIIDKDVSEVYGKEVSDIDLFVTSTEKEKRFVEDKFGYNSNEVICTGIARYDYLENLNKENLIVFMPTWRRNLLDTRNIYEDEIYREKFLNSSYYLEINKFLKNDKLKMILEEYNYKLLFIPHHMFDKYNDLFEENNRIKKYRMSDINIAKILGQAKIFITDYSSIHFDSAYIGNINLYYQFDKDEFYSVHAKKSYFDYEVNGFGKVICREEDLIEEINKILLSNQEREFIYSKRVQEFFKYVDKNNSLRICEEIEKRC